jgi:hypothetical protein
MRALSMGKYVMVVQSRAKEGRDAEYNKWYDTTHLAQICAIAGVKSGRRFEATPISAGAPGLKYLTLYEIETDDPGAVMAELGKRSVSGAITPSDSLDAPAAVLWIYKAYEP